MLYNIVYAYLNTVHFYTNFMLIVVLTIVGTSVLEILVHHGGSWHPSRENVYVRGIITMFSVSDDIEEKQILKYVT